MRLFKITTVVCILALLCSFAIACAPKLEVSEEGIIDFTNLKKVEGLSAYDLYKEVEKTWHNDKNYHRQDFFSFSAVDKDISFASQQSVFTSYRDGDKQFTRNVVIGTGAGEKHDITSSYSDGKNIYFTSMIKDKKNVYQTKDKLDPFKDDFYTVEDYGTFLTLDDYNKTVDVADKINYDDFFKHNFQHLTTYNTDKKEYLSKDHDDNVYEIAKDEVAFIITIDCSLDKINSAQVEARDEFIRNTGAKNEGFSMLKDSTIQITAKKINGVWKMTSWVRTEDYQGKVAIVTLKCHQQSRCKITYDDYTITDEIIKTKLPA